MSPSARELLWAGVFGRDAAAIPDPVPGGVILFARNLDPDPAAGPERCHALIRELQARSPETLAMAVDQEGGAVSRLKAWVGPTPSFRRIWERGGAGACERWGALWGRGLALLGFNVDFAPVADLWDGHEGTGMGDRCASTAPLEVSRAVGAFLHGLEGQGVRGCLKHFPGLGGTRVDSHKSLPVLEDPAQVSLNLKPFIPLAHAARLVMVAHLRTPHSGALPASLHRESVAANPWGIQGRWIPDDLEMGGCTDWDWDTRVRLCLEAGHDALLVCQTPEGIARCAEAAARQPEGLRAPAAERFRAFRAALPRGPERFEREAWDAWREELAREAEAFHG